MDNQIIKYNTELERDLLTRIRGLEGRLKEEKDKAKLAKEDLRDRFAMAALTGYLAWSPETNNRLGEPHETAELMFKIADAMLEARKKLQPVPTLHANMSNAEQVTPANLGQANK